MGAPHTTTKDVGRIRYMDSYDKRARRYAALEVRLRTTLQTASGTLHQTKGQMTIIPVENRLPL
jgi:hypothetical protein